MPPRLWLPPSVSEGIAITPVTIVGGGGGDEPGDLFSIDFSDYATTAALLADSATWNTAEDLGTTNISLVTQADIEGHYAALVAAGKLAPGTAPPPLPAGATKAMAYHYNHGAVGCSSITITRALLLAAALQELYGEFWVLFSPNFRTTQAACAPNDLKFLFGDTEAGENGRWALYVGSDSGPDHTNMIETPSRSGGSGGSGQVGAYYLNGIGNPTPLQQWQANEWTRHRAHFRNSTTASSLDARARWLRDNHEMHNETGFNTHSSGTTGTDKLTGFSFCHNKDDGPANEDMYIYWGPINVHSAAPSWAA